MSEVFNIHMAADLTEWTSTVTDSGDLSQAAGAGLGGTSGGMSVLIDDTTAIYGQKNFNKSGTVRFRFYVDPNTITMANNDSFEIVRQASVSAGLPIATTLLEYTTAGGYRLRVRIYNDAGAAIIGVATNITDEPHYVEFLIVQAATDVSADGSGEVWIDGASVVSGSNVDNYNRMGDQNWRIRLGALESMDVGTSGTFYLDELVANDDGSEIGPVSSGAYTLSAAQQTYTLGGQAANVLFGRKFAAAQAVFNQSREPANLRYRRLLGAVKQDYTLTGIEVTLTKSASGAYTLSAAQQSYNLAGQAANVLFGRKFAAAQAAYTLGGQAANVLQGYVISQDARSGIFDLARFQAQWFRTYNLAAVRQDYQLTGWAAELRYGIGTKLVAVYAAFVLTAAGAWLRINQAAPGERIYGVAGEARLLAVEGEERTRVVGGESRKFEVE